MASIVPRPGLAPFLADALRPLLARPLFGPVIVLTILLTLSDIVILLDAPARGQMPGPAFLAAAAVRVLGVLVFSVAILRLLNRSVRPPWRPDGAFWLAVLVFLLQLAASLAVGLASRLLVGRDPVTETILDALIGVATLPLAAWFTAIAVERPLAWRPGRWLRAWSAWLPHLILWTVILTVPLAALHSAIGRHLIAGAGAWFWPLALVDGPLSLLVLLSGLAFASEAYRRVARG